MCDINLVVLFDLVSVIIVFIELRWFVVYIVDSVIDLVLDEKWLFKWCLEM